VTVHVNHLAGVDGVAAALAAAAATAPFGFFFDTFGFVGGGAVVSAAGCSLVTVSP